MADRRRPVRTDEVVWDDWRDHAACRGEDPELFFPVGTTGPALDQIEAAKAICRRCPVLAECLAWAMEHGEDAGVWGGLTTDERRALRRRRARRLDAGASVGVSARASG